MKNLILICEEFFDLCDTPQDDDELISKLYSCLVKLNFYFHNLEEPNFPKDNETVFRLNDSELRAKIGPKFKDLGLYPVADPLTFDSMSCLTGDAIDDLIDIYKDLKEGYDHYTNGQVDNAVWVWNFGYEHHWGQHLVELQMLLYHMIYIDKNC